MPDLFDQIEEAATELARLEATTSSFPQVRERRIAEAQEHLDALLEKAKLGSGARFKALEKELKGKKGVYDPAGLAAWIGRKKYGGKKMAKLSAAGRKESLDESKSRAPKSDALMSDAKKAVLKATQSLQREAYTDEKYAQALEHLKSSMSGLGRAQYLLRH
jgi:hypothetical protein